MNNRKTAGQSLMELAITLPLLLLIVMGVFDLGRGIYYLSAIHNSAREAARYGAVNHCDKVGIKEKAKLTAIGLGDGLILDDPDPQSIYVPGTSELDYVLVTVKFSFEPVTPLVGRFFGGGGKVELTSTARQLIEVSYICP